MCGDEKKTLYNKLSIHSSSVLRLMTLYTLCLVMHEQTYNSTVRLLY